MARLHQLKMLLWKNFQVKRRMPLILILETIIPFVLFILLGLVRHQEPIQRTKTTFSAAYPLPSAGLTSMIQHFMCGKQLPRDGDGLPYLTENSTYFNFLFKIDNVYRTISRFDFPINQAASTDDLLSSTLYDLAWVAEHLPISDSCKNKSASTISLTKLLQVGMAKFYETLCGGFPNNRQTNNNNMTAIPDSSLLFGSEQFNAFLMFWHKFLTGQLKILYTPGKSPVVQNVISRVNSTFHVVDEIAKFADHWLTNVSKSMRLRFANYPEKLAAIDVIDSAACWWLDFVEKASFSMFIPFDNEFEAINYAINRAEKEKITVFAVIVFIDVNENTTTLPPHTSYKLRMNSTYLYSVKRLRPLYWSPMPRNWDLFYYSSGFLFLQDALDRAIISSFVGKKIVEPGAFTELSPMPCYLYDTFLFTNSMILPLCMTISYVYAAAILVQNIVSEKENGLKEFMKVMGLDNSVHGAAWFITAFIQLTFSVLVVTCILTISNVLAHSNPVIIFLILETYAVATITFAFLVSSLHSKAKIASATGGMLYFLSYVPSMTISLQEDFVGVPVSIVTKLFTCFLSTSAFGISCKYIGLRESEGVGVHWGNLAVSPIEHDSFTLLHSVGMLLVDVFLYAVLAWYIENVKPGDFGIPKPWYFPLSKAYWTGEEDNGYQMPKCVQTCYKCAGQFVSNIKFGRRNIEAAEENNNDREMQFASLPSSNNNNYYYYEPDPEGLVLGVEIDHLTKVYGTGKVAVNDLSLKLYQTQITALLGHNGAGKTSAMSVLCGLHSPTSGTVRIYGLDIRQHLDTIRNSVGYCPQHNILIDHLTPEEHLRFYGGLKRACQPVSEEDIQKILDDVGLSQKKCEVVAHLSGGMKRKLSIAISFLGNPRLVILDEPTAGIDPYSRRAIWELLIRYKQDRTILMSTHLMQEADVLSDRIALIANGALKCCGSSLFLRSQFCDGYHLICVKDDDQRGMKSTEEMHVVDFVKARLSSAYLHSETKEELHFVIPYNEERNGMMIPFFKELGASLGRLGITSVGVYDSTLEEAFLKITGANNNNLELLPSTISRRSLITSCSTLNSSSFLSSEASINHVAQSELTLQHQPTNIVGFFRRHFKHFRALMIKRFIHVRRSWKVLFTQIILPAVFIAIAMTMSLSASLTGDLPPFALVPSQYNIISQPVGIFTPVTNYAARRPTTTTVTTKRDDANANEITQTLHMISGLSAQCILKSTATKISHVYHYGNITNKKMLRLFNHECNEVFAEGVPLSAFNPSPHDDHLLQEEHAYYPECTCFPDLSGFDCPTYSVKPPQHQMIAGDHLIDIGSQNMTEYLLYTTDDFKLHRYGGLVFGPELAHVPKKFGGDDGYLQKLAVRRVAVAFYDNRGYHAQPIYLNVLNNAILRANVAKRPELGNPAAYGITVYNHPINGTDKVSNQDLAVQGADMVIAVFIIIAMSFVPASFVVFVVYERSLLVKHIQFMAGLHPVTYWIANFVWDSLNYLIPASCAILILVAFNVPAYVEGDNIKAVIGLFMLYGWSMTPTMYPLSFLLNEPSKAYVLLVVLNLFLGTTCVITTSLLDIFSRTPVLKTANDALKYAFLPVPSYCLGRGIMDIALNHYKNQFFKLSGKDEKVVSPLSWHVVVEKYLVMAVEGLICFALTIVLEMMSRRNFTIFPKCDNHADQNSTDSNKKDCYGSSPSSDGEEDEDVVAERKRIVLGGSDDDFLVIDQLSKKFRSKSGVAIQAVNRLTVGMPEAEIFGLLGLNGAGKSTTFSMLAGICNATSGEARLGCNILCSSIMPSVKVLRKIGYCPQTDPLLDELTGREHLQFYARIHNVPSSSENAVVDSLLEKMGLETYADKPCRTYSGGMKRKLSAALSLVGNPSVILLDEPTTGMDPRSRRFLWDVILKLRQEKRLVVLTSHSMEECEALCSRLAIMVAGRLKCLGSTQQLKDKFGKGYTITVRLPSGGTFDQEAFSQVFSRYGISPDLWRVTARRHQSIELALLASRPDLSKLFDALAHLKRSETIREFSVSQNTLDNVFLYLANNKDRHPSLMIADADHEQ